MTSAIDRARAKFASAPPSPRSAIGKALRAQGGVRRSGELRRIAGLARRPAAPTTGAAEELTALLRSASGKQTLKEIQAWALEEAHARGGLLAPIVCGGGKTLISILLAETFARVGVAKRVALIVPGGLREKTVREARRIREHWRCDLRVTAIERETSKRPREGILVISYEMLGREDYASLLDVLFPDVIVCDEAHKLKNRKAAVTKRVLRYVEAHRERVRCCFMSGTLVSTKLEHLAHLADAALEAGSPVPREYGEIVEWSIATDEDLPPDVQRIGPGALVDLMDEGEALLAQTAPVAAARATVGRRILETEGVVSSAPGDDGVGASLSIRIVPIDDYSPATDEAFERLAQAWETPDGWPITQAIDKWRHEIELACGFYYVWNPRPPREWLAARTAWGQSVRYVLAHNRRNLDSELQVFNAARRGELDREHLDAWHAWIDVRDSFEPNTEPRWIDEAISRRVRTWRPSAHGIVWADHAATGDEIAKTHGLSYYRQGGRDARGVLIDDATEHVVVASIDANRTGRNLQTRAANLVLPCSLGAEAWEQLISRTHRQGQRADEVTVEVLVGCAAQYRGWLRARAHALAIRETTRQDQRILFADVDDDVEANASELRGPRWAGLNEMLEEV